MTDRDELLAALVDERFGPIPPPLAAVDTEAIRARRREELTEELRSRRARRRGARLRAARLAAEAIPPPAFHPEDEHAARLLAGVTRTPKEQAP